MRPAVFALSLLAAALSFAETPVATFPAPFDSSDWTRLLNRYVDERGLVSYARWKANPEDLKRFDVYLAAFGSAGKEASPGQTDEKVALLVNAYNAFIVRAVLERYPVETVRSIPDLFTSESRRFGGRNVSLDEIEHTAVALSGYRVHATIVCASKSCPPLDRRAYEAGTLSARENERMRVWMSRPELFRFDPERNVAAIPKYFDWYRSDFERAGIPAVLAAYAPERYRRWLAGGAFKVEFLEYDWSLNERPARASSRSQGRSGEQLAAAPWRGEDFGR